MGILIPSFCLTSLLYNLHSRYVPFAAPLAAYTLRLANFDTGNYLSMFFATRSAHCKYNIYYISHDISVLLSVVLY